MESESVARHRPTMNLGGIKNSAFKQWGELKPIRFGWSFDLLMLRVSTKTSSHIYQYITSIRHTLKQSKSATETPAKCVSGTVFTTANTVLRCKSVSSHHTRASLLCLSNIPQSGIASLRQHSHKCATFVMTRLIQCSLHRIRCALDDVQQH